MIADSRVLVFEEDFPLMVRIVFCRWTCMETYLLLCVWIQHFPKLLLLLFGGIVAQ